MDRLQEAATETTLKDAEDAVDELYYFRDHYFETNGVEKAAIKQDEVKAKLHKTLTTLDYVKATSEETARCLFLQGKALNVTAEYDPRVLDALSKAVKLDPKLLEAWNCLGECYWKKGDVEAARNCFTGALQHFKNKVSLRNLSMVLRQIGKDQSERLENVKISVEKAKEAVSLDVNDGISWYILGNAYLSMFFSGSQNPQLLKQCMSSYSQAEKDPVAANNPDLHFNRAMAYKYQEDYKNSVVDFIKAEALDPGWKEPSQQKNKLINYLIQKQELAKTKGKLKAKRLKTMMQSISDTDLGPYGGGSYTSHSGKSVQLTNVPISKLQPEVNPNKVVIGKVVGSVPMDDPLPYTFVVIDKEGECVPVTVYNMAAGAGFVVGDTIAIPEPFVQVTDFTAEDKIFQFSSIRVDSPVVLVVNKRKLGANKLAPSVLAVTAMSE